MTRTELARARRRHHRRRWVLSSIEAQRAYLRWRLLDGHRCMHFPMDPA